MVAVDRAGDRVSEYFPAERAAPLVSNDQRALRRERAGAGDDTEQEDGHPDPDGHRCLASGRSGGGLMEHDGTSGAATCRAPTARNSAAA